MAIQRRDNAEPINCRVSAYAVRSYLQLESSALFPRRQSGVATGMMSRGDQLHPLVFRKNRALFSSCLIILIAVLRSSKVSTNPWTAVTETQGTFFNSVAKGQKLS